MELRRRWGRGRGGCGGPAAKAQLPAEPEGQSLPLICLFWAECVGGIAASLDLLGYLASRRPVGAVFPASPDWTHAGDHRAEADRPPADNLSFVFHTGAITVRPKAWGRR